jgi:N-acetylmuramoyl-L-alanine amidase
MSSRGSTTVVRRSILFRLAHISRLTAILAAVAAVAVAAHVIANPPQLQFESAVPGTGLAGQPAGRPRHPHVGIVAGHWGNDSGSVCPDGVTEQQINFDIARRAKEMLDTRGYRVDLLQEFDPRLSGYVADVLLSIHADSCEYINDLATGFKVARSVASYEPETEDQLVNCLKRTYAQATGLAFHANSITPDMTSYHSFSEVAPDTPAAIIETGFLYLDRGILLKEPERVASGIANGIVCFVEKK